MPEDERTRRRVGDDTKGRIAELASGWSLESPAAAPAPTPELEPARPVQPASGSGSDTLPQRSKAKSVPPPPPGSAARKALEDAVVASIEIVPRTDDTIDRMLNKSLRPTDTPVPGVPVVPAPPAARRPTGPPPPPRPRDKPTTNPPVAEDRPTVPDLPRNETDVPVGEFEASPAMLTVKRDAASALLNEPPPRPTPLPVRPDPTTVDPSITHSDPTRTDSADAPLHRPGSRPGGSLRHAPALRRKRGIGGDMRYVATVVFGVRQSRRELAVLEVKQASRLVSRRHHLITLGRIAVTADAFEHAALTASRDPLAANEERREKLAAELTTADAALGDLRRAREGRAKQLIIELAAIDAEVAGLAEKQAPLDREAATIRKRVTELRDSITRIEAKISGTEATLVSVKGQKLDKASIQADIAMLRADRDAIRGDEPAIAAELDALNPRIAAIEAARIDARARRARLEADEQSDQRRTEELVTAAGAKRKVVERAVGDAEAEHEQLLFELGEELDVDRPVLLAGEMASIDSIDVDLATGDRRIMELREILSSVDRWKFARGLAVIVLILGAIATGLVYFLFMR